MPVLLKKEIELIKYNKSIHDNIARKYDEHHTEIYNKFEQKRIHSVLSEAVSLTESGSKNKLFLDFGCGTGNLTKQLLSFGEKIVCADISEASLDILTSKFNNAPLIKTFVLNGKDISEHKDGTFDFIATYSVLHHLPDYTSIIGEFMRVLKPGGVVYIDHEVSPNYWTLDAVYMEYLSELGGNFRANHLHELGLSESQGLTYEGIKNRIRNFRTFFTRKFLMSKSPEFLHEGDIHTNRYDHIEWDRIRKALESNLSCDKVVEKDYLLCREDGDDPGVWRKWQDKCVDMRYMIARKKRA